jgi:hypothetical protein
VKVTSSSTCRPEKLRLTASTFSTLVMAQR